MTLLKSDWQAGAVNMKNKLNLVVYGVLLAALAWWSWILTAPNLVLSTWAPYWNWQNWMWQTFYANRALICVLYAAIISALLIIFWKITKEQKFARPKHFLVTMCVTALPLLFSFNALSFDVFNYLFNAKMVAVYHANPHEQVALDFSSDPWTRFMHNTHTAAPYGYAWTGISLIPFYLSGGKFASAWLMTRGGNFLLLIATGILMCKWQKKIAGKYDFKSLALFFFNPLVLIELLMNMHNDLWMMWPALWALYLIYPSQKNGEWTKVKAGKIMLSAAALFFSMTIKYSTLTLLPVWLFLLILPWLKKNKLMKIKKLAYTYIFDGAAGLMFLPLLTSRAQLFHPWYLLWSLSFLPFCKSKIVQTSLLILSATSLYRYLPNLWVNGYETETLFYQQLITIVPLLFYLIGIYAHKVLLYVQKNK